MIKEETMMLRQRQKVELQKVKLEVAERKVLRFYLGER